MKKAVLTLALVLATACGGPVATSPTPTATTTPSASSTPQPSASPSASASPSKSPIPLPTGAQVAAAGNGVVWMLVADRLFLSTDKGATWTERAMPSNVNPSIAFIDAKQGWILSVGSPATQCQAQKADIWHTADGAASWQKLDVSGIADALCKADLAFVDAQHGYFDAYSPNDQPLIYRTGDGGKTWSSTRLQDPPGFTTKPGGFTLRAGPVADLGGAIYVAASGNTGTKLTTYVFHWSDATASWQFTNTTPDTEPGAQIVFLTPTRWLAPIAPAPWAETTDSGSTWHPYATDYQQAAPIAPQIVFGDANTGYATVRGGLQRTVDGGLHWTALKTPGT